MKPACLAIRLLGTQNDRSNENASSHRNGFIPTSSKRRKLELLACMKL